MFDEQEPSICELCPHRVCTNVGNTGIKIMDDKDISAEGRETHDITISHSPIEKCLVRRTKLTFPKVFKKNS